MADKIPAGMFLRVSTTGQATAAGQGNEADIPTQRAACEKFIAQHPEWELVREYIEVGSAFSKSAGERDELMRAQGDIKAGTIKALVVFMFDRLGRIEAETPFVVQNFVQMGAEVWSVREGQRKFESHVDSLINYITFWQAGGESKKTSERVTSAMTLMAEQGLYTGGKTPYGYRTVETGRVTKKQLPEKTLVINEDEAAVVRRAFDLALSSGYGCHRVARTLNEEGLRNRNGNQWSHSAVSNMLRNPLYKGVKAYNRTTGKGLGKKQVRLPPEQWTLAEQPNPAWVIILQADWEAVNRQKTIAVAQQKAQQEYNDTLRDTGVIDRTKLLFGGFAYCGICGAKMITGYSPYRWKTQDGVTKRKDNPVYRCGNRSSGKLGCTAKSSYQKHKVEDAILAELHGYFDRLRQMELSADISELQKQNTATEEKIIKQLGKEIDKTRKELSGLEDEILKVITGESPLPRDTLERMLSERKGKLDELVVDLTAAEELLSRKKIEQTDLEMLREVIPVWSEVFDNATVDEQKVMLSKVIERVDVSPGDMKVQLRLHVREFIGSVAKKPTEVGKKRAGKVTANSIDKVRDKDVTVALALIAEVHENFILNTS